MLGVFGFLGAIFGIPLAIRFDSINTKMKSDAYDKEHREGAYSPYNGKKLDKFKQRDYYHFYTDHGSRYTFNHPLEIRNYKKDNVCAERVRLYYDIGTVRDCKTGDLLQDEWGSYISYSQEELKAIAAYEFEFDSGCTWDERSPEYYNPNSKEYVIDKSPKMKAMIEEYKKGRLNF